MRRVHPALLVGVVGLVLLVALAVLRQPVMPAYLAAWLFWMALPLGALPMVMLLELLGVRGWTLNSVLRRLLLLLPPGALLAIPLMLRAVPLFVRPGLPGWWMQPGFLLARMIVMLLVWTALAILFCRPPANGLRRRMATLGLALHLVMGTIAALDWVLALDPGIGSSSIGLLLMAAQVSTALCAAALLLALVGEVPAEVPPLMIGLLLAWMFLHFTQYLVIWSANLPGEVVWYQRRVAGLGAAAIWSAASAALLALAALLPYGLCRTPWVMASIAAMLLFGHAVEMLWLVTPPFRGAMLPSWSDLPALLGLGGLALFLLSSLPTRPSAPAHAHT